MPFFYFLISYILLTLDWIKIFCLFFLNKLNPPEDKNFSIQINLNCCRIILKLILFEIVLSHFFLFVFIYFFIFHSPKDQCKYHKRALRHGYRSRTFLLCPNYLSMNQENFSLVRSIHSPHLNFVLFERTLKGKKGCRLLDANGT